MSIIKNPIAMGVVAIGAILLGSMSAYTVSETNQAIITSYGKVKYTVNAYQPGKEFGETNAGLHFRIPFVDQVQYVDKRVLSLEMNPQEVLSTDQLQVQVNAFARFRITEPVTMFKTLRTESAVISRLGETLGSSVRNELGKRSFATMLSAERGQIMSNIQQQLNLEAKRYGAEVIDVRIKRADLPEGTPLDSAFKRMRSAREQERATIEAEGRKEAQIIRADAEAEAARVYAASYGQDPEFYDFYRAMESYKQTFISGQGETNFLLSPNSDYLRKFQNAR